MVLVWHTNRLHRSNIELEDYINVVEPREISTETVTAGIIDLTPRSVALSPASFARSPGMSPSTAPSGSTWPASGRPDRASSAADAAPTA